MSEPNQSGNPFGTNAPAAPPAESFNPYAAPTSNVDIPAATDNHNLIENGRAVGSGRATAWLGKGWELFKAAPGMWIGMLIVYFLVTIVAAIIPLVNMIASIGYPIFVAGFLIGCRALDQGDSLDMSHLFAGFQTNFGSLVLLCLLYLVCIIVLVIPLIVVGVVMGGMAIFTESKALGIGTFLTIFALGFVLFVPIMMAMLFAPALVALNNVQPLDAMKQSFYASLKNFGPMTLYGIIVIVLMVLASIPLMLGWLVLGPVLIGSAYGLYKDVFLGDET